MNTALLQQMSFLFAILLSLALPVSIRAEDAPKVRVVIWDERQPEQKSVYKLFLGNRIGEYLKSLPGFEVTSVGMDDAEHGLTKEVLDNCDVLIWWGHKRNREVPPEKGKDILTRIKSGQLSLIALHSAHWSVPFIEAMRDRAVTDAIGKLTDEQRKTVKVNIISPKLDVPKKTDPLTPSSQLRTEKDGSSVLDITLPICVFPAWRADGAPSHVTTLLPDHPIAKDIPAKFDILQDEMYDEPFHVPAPDQVVFEEHWDKGEYFRGGCVWKIGNGKVFYFRPGHETFGVFNEKIPLQIISNAARWMTAK